MKPVLLALLLAAAWISPGRLLAAGETPFGLDKRVPWTTSRVVGSPEPPLPFTLEKTFTNLVLKAPIFAIAEPGTDSLIVIQQGGEKDRPSRMFRFRDDPAVTNSEPFLEVSGRIVYSIEFHPGYKTNGFVYVFSNGPTPQPDRTNRISRYFVGRDGQRRCDPASEKVIVEWRSAGHDGGGLVFGHDGMLYITSGDGTSDSDGWDTGQDITDLAGGVLRLDVDHPDAGRNYSVPKDNPFWTIKGARPELWAYGLRNPWRMCVDEKSGRIWVGVNGQDLWETAHLLRRGENYGWSAYEGSHPFYLTRKLGPTPVVRPTIEHPHSEFRSLTGGAVYRGAQIPELDGYYIYGDYSSGQIWGALHDGSKMKVHKQLAESQLQIVAFANDHRGGLLVVDLGGGIYRLVKPAKQAPAPKFPIRLSETGLFASTRDHRLQPGVVPYSVNAPAWLDGASVDRFIALPDDTRIEYSGGSGSWSFTNGAVLVQTISLPDPSAKSASPRRVETRLLTRQKGQWVGYSYRWSKDQSDATLVPANGLEVLFGGPGHQTWKFPARSECMACHSRQANFVLGLSEVQLNRSHDYGPVRDNQLRALEHAGFFRGSVPKDLASVKALSNPYDPAGNLEARARSYLHVNCSGCHVEAGGGNSKMDLRFGVKSEAMGLLGARPQHDSFGIPNAMLAAPSDPDHSVILQRLSRRGRGQMPPLVLSRVDEAAVALLRDWIRSIPSAQTFVRDWKMEDLEPKLPELAKGRSFASGQAAFRQVGCAQCHRFQGEGGSVGPDLAGVAKRLAPREILESVLLPSKVIAEGFATTEIETADGEPVTGRIESEDAKVVLLRPVGASAEVLTIPKSKIRRRELSKTSNMPAGIANTLAEKEILDLLAYLLSDGHAEAAPFAPVK